MIDYIQLSKDIIIRLLEDKDTDYFSSYLSKDINILGIHNKNIKERIIEFKNNIAIYKVKSIELHIVASSENICVLEGIIVVNDDNIELTIIFNNYFISHIHYTNISNNKELLPKAGVYSYYLDDFKLYSFNDTMASLLGYNNNEFMALYHFKPSFHVYYEDFDNYRNTIINSLKQDSKFEIEYRAIKKDSNLIWVIEQGEVFKDENGNKIISSFVSDIDFIKQCELESLIQQQKYSLILKDDSIDFMEYDIKSDRMIVDVHEESKKKIYNHYLDYIASSKSTVFEEDKQLVYDLFSLKNKSAINIKEHIRGTNKFTIKHINPIVINDFKKNPIIVLATVKDITEEWNRNELLEQRQSLDPLTHLWNIEISKKKIKEYLNIKDNNESFALMLLDIDYFKTINDNYGNLFGNNVLINLSNCLKSNVREDDILGRFGGDEFIILLKNINHVHTIIKAKDILNEIRNIKLEKDIIISASIGIYVSNDNENFKEMFEKADLALASVKKHGRNNYLIYDSKE